jgi:hypothetical protein
MLAAPLRRTPLHMSLVMAAAVDDSRDVRLRWSPASRPHKRMSSLHCSPCAILDDDRDAIRALAAAARKALPLGRASSVDRIM